MSVYAITYDLNKSGQNYKDLYDEIKSLGDWWHYLDSTWLVDVRFKNADDIYKQLSKHLDKNDYILIIKVTRDYQGWLPEEAWDWIREHI